MIVVHLEKRCGFGFGYRVSISGVGCDRAIETEIGNSGQKQQRKVISRIFVSLPEICFVTGNTSAASEEVRANLGLRRVNGDEADSCFLSVASEISCERHGMEVTSVELDCVVEAGCWI